TRATTARSCSTRTGTTSRSSTTTGPSSSVCAMVRRIVLAALACAVLAPAADAAQEVDWSRLPYLVDTQPKLILGTDATWSGARVATVGRFTPADATFGLTRSFKRRYIWGPSCGPPLEQRRFTKTIVVPGRPSAGTFNLGYGPARGGQPFEGA